MSLSSPMEVSTWYLPWISLNKACTPSQSMRQRRARPAIGTISKAAPMDRLNYQRYSLIYFDTLELCDCSFSVFIWSSLINKRVVAFFFSLSLSVPILCCFLGAGKVWMTLFHLLFLVDKTFPEMSSALCVRVYVYLSLAKSVPLWPCCVGGFSYLYIYIYIFSSPLSLSLSLLCLSLCTWVGLVAQRTIVHLFVSSSFSVVFFPFDDNNIAICTIE